ncbi:sensor domain-containing protein [Mycolicibacterium rufum]|uniref:Sensor domain-containing protein n=1 Tax=Mycolicibacterium rufum TaxID=318424 RepID=A0ABY3ULM1_9MYCO|nr:sensor domain-containing protein [Mycolicibacterium rufum]ULP39364.1 sensor domain-containing protein [Mycolicibacterium rufum]
MARLAPVAAATAALVFAAGCTRQIDDARPQPAALAEPITALQVADLLSPAVKREEGNLFVSADPTQCAGLAREVDPPFIAAGRPLATAGGHWTSDDGLVFVEEMVAVYRSEFDPAAARRTVTDALAACRGTRVSVRTMSGHSYDFDVTPSAGGAPPDSALWSLRAADWNCDNAFVAAYNAAVEITACGTAGGPDTAALAEQARRRIEALANTTA